MHERETGAALAESVGTSRTYIPAGDNSGIVVPLPPNK